MDHKWKKTALADLIKYNKYLIILVLILSATCFALSMGMLNKEDKMVIIPYSDINNKIQVSTKKPHISYLKPWAVEIAKEIFTTSPDDIDEQHSRIIKIATSNKELKAFFEKQKEFVNGSKVSSVFFPKETSLVEDGVLVSGTLHYWFADSKEKITASKSYKISYRNKGNGLILLSNIEEQPIQKKQG